MSSKFNQYLLNTMCGHLNIKLDHHKADSDSIACGKLLIEYMRSDIDISKFIRTYDFEELRTVQTNAGK